MQVNISSDASREWIFAEVPRGSGAWLYGPGSTAAEAHMLADDVELDAFGWPTRSPPGVMVRTAPSQQTGAATNLYGVYVLTRGGAGQGELWSTHNDGVEVSPARAAVDLTPV